MSSLCSHRRLLLASSRPPTPSTCRAIAARAGLRPKTRWPAFELALRDRRHDARARPRDDQGRRAGRQPRPPPQSGSSRAGRTANSSKAQGPAIRSLTFAELQRYDVGRLKPGTAYAASFPEQRAADGARIPALTEVFDLVEAQRRRSCALQYRDQDHADLRRRDARSGNASPQLVAKAIREAGLTARVSVQSFDWRTLVAMQTHRAGDRARLPHRRRRRSTTISSAASPGPRPGPPGSTSTTSPARCRAWSRPPAARSGRPISAMSRRTQSQAAKALGLKVIPWTVNERADMERLIALGVDGIITDYPGPPARRDGRRAMPPPPRSA